MNAMNDMGPPLFSTEDRQCKGNISSLKKSLCFIGVIYLVCTAMVIISAVRSGNNPVSGVLILTVVSGIMTAEQVLRGKRSADNNYNVFCFYDDCYVNIDRLSRTTVPYKLILKAVETKNAFVIYIEPMRKHIILKETVSKEAADELGSFLSSKITNYKRI